MTMVPNKIQKRMFQETFVHQKILFKQSKRAAYVGKNVS